MELACRLERRVPETLMNPGVYLPQQCLHVAGACLVFAVVPRQKPRHIVATDEFVDLP